MPSSAMPTGDPWGRDALAPELVQLAVMVFAALAVGGVVYVLVAPLLSGERHTGRRIATAARGQAVRRSSRTGNAEQLYTRKRQVQDTLKELEAQQKSQKKVTLLIRLRRAGLTVQPRAYYIASAVTGLLVVVLALVSGSSPAVSLFAGFAAAFGLPRWTLNYLTRRRQKSFLREFANALDVIVRGVKSGLPLNDCLQIIAREAPSPVREEFEDLVEKQRVGVPLAKAFERMYERIPLQEVNFFAIVISIQQQTGGNLAEALGNLAAVLRDRQRLAGKVAAFSAEAKTSAAIIGALPPIVMLLVYMSTPDYIALLWTEPVGKIMLMASAVWMLIGVLVMRKMINFDY